MKGLARLAPAAVAAILLTAGIVTLAPLTTHDNKSLLVHFQGVPDQDLLNSGVSLTAPQGPAKIDLRTAVSAANSPGASGGVKETVLVHLKEANSVPPVDQDVWVVSYDVAGQPWSGGPFLPRGETPPPIVYKWSLWFIDAQTGDFVSGMQAAGPP